ncbi:hypothetical protein N7494_001333 [Penicillium frequentans]|uniref:Uncharacterized protein n=1 Tax=Penicillium frequentans TaxID=3151616 RepID=A0AAD6GM51_9EURO|nr:hypothetical protein N7494_001333 [Penicillium glabrum]
MLDTHQLNYDSYTHIPSPISDHCIVLEDLPCHEVPALGGNPNDSLRKGTSTFYIPKTLWTRTFLTVVALEIVATTVIEIWILIDVSKWTPANNSQGEGLLWLRSFLGLAVFALLYELALSYEGLSRQNIFQLSGYHLRLMLVPIFMGVAVIAMVGVTWKLRAEFSWSLYKTISADSHVQRKLYNYQVYVALLKFDFFFIFASQTQVLIALGEIGNEFIFNAVMIAVAVVILCLAAIFCRKEMKLSMSIPIVGMGAIIASQVKTLLSLYKLDGILISHRVSLGLFATISILLITCTIIYAFLCIVSFDKRPQHHSDQLRDRRPSADSV